MAYFPDLGSESQIASGSHVRAIGWLSSAHRFPLETTVPGLVARLETFRAQWGHSVEALSWPVAGGPHTCEFCDRHRDSANFAVPAADFLYVCPGMIVHYVSAHEYAPPQEFIDAIFRSPDPASYDYYLSCARFHPALRLKSQAIREVVCLLRTHLGRHAIAAYPSDEDGADAIWVADYNVRSDQARLRIECVAPDRYDLQLGHGPFHEQTPFALTRSYDAVSIQEIVRIVEEAFELPDR